MTKPPYSVSTLAARWGCSKRQITNMVKRGELRGFRVGALLRFTVGEVEAYECGTGSQSTKGDTSRFSMKEAVDAELRLKRLTGSRLQQKQRNLSVISNSESHDRD